MVGFIIDSSGVFTLEVFYLEITKVLMYIYQMLEIENIEFQKRIMQYISVGYTPKEIATEIGQGCNNRTIEHYIETMKKRYQVKNTPALLAMFFRRKLIK